MTQQWKFKTDHALDKRRDIVRRLRDSYPERVPIVIEPDARSGLDLHKVRFLAPRDSTLQKLFVEIRKQTQNDGQSVPPDMALYVLFGNAQVMAPLSRTVGQLQAQCADPEDGMLYGRLLRESTFGSCDNQNMTIV